MLGFLQQHVEPTRLGIEVRVPQLPGPNRKEAVTKDVVIWAAPFENVFTQPNQVERIPTAIMEWKCHPREASPVDVEWLRTFTTAHPTCTGYAISLFRDDGHWDVNCWRVHGAEVTRL